MAYIVDISPTCTNTHGSDPGQPLDPNRQVTGRMLSLACAPDSSAVFAGSYSNLWTSSDDGQNWSQITWPQPPDGQFEVPGAMGGWCVADVAVALGWRVDRHPRMLATFAPGGPAGIIGFGDCGVWTALSDGAGGFAPPQVVVPNLGYTAGGWHVDEHPRMTADLTGNGGADIVGFGYAGVWTALGNGDGSFKTPQLVLANMGLEEHWRVDRHPRFAVDLTGNGRADLVGFGTDSVYTAIGWGDGSFQDDRHVLDAFCYAQGWRVDRHPRFVMDLTGNGFADIIGFADHGVWTALGNGDGTFQKPKFVLENFGHDQGWRVDRHPRFLADLNNNGFLDIIGFGDAGVWTAFGNGDGTFQNAQFALGNLGYDQGWRVDEHPRFVADLNGDGNADLVGFGIAGVWTAIGTGYGTFEDAQFVQENFGYEQGWRVDQHPRLVGDLTGDGKADLVGFGDAGVWTAIGDGQGGFPSANFTLGCFGAQQTILAITTFDLTSNSRGLWRSTDSGANWTLAHQFPPGEQVGQLLWAEGSDHIVYAAGGSSLARSLNGGVTFTDLYPFGDGGRVNHVAAWQNDPADLWPAVLYALGYQAMSVSFDGGATWLVDQGTLPDRVGGTISMTANGTAPSVMVVSPRWPLEVFICADGSGAAADPALWRGSYDQFPFGSLASSWEHVTLPDMGGQDSGNTYVATTRRGCGDLLFYGAQRSPCWVGPLYPDSGDAWRPLSGNVHVDQHGVLLAPDFAATLHDGDYTHLSGTMWLINDGGIWRSTDGGVTVTPACGATTLSVVNVGAAPRFEIGPAMSLNNGDNDGFFSLDGGQNWTYQEYGGGDNDTSFADPLRADSMLIFTPRWDTNAHGQGVRNGQTVTIYESPGNPPDGSIQETDRRAVTGPPLAAPNAPGIVWNAISYYAIKGFRPIVLGLTTDALPTEGDYIFILFDPVKGSWLLRTLNIFDITSRAEWSPNASGPGMGANVFHQGPQLPRADIGVAQASGGHVSTVFYVGGDTDFTLWMWKKGKKKWTQLVPGNGIQSAIRFFAHPYDPQVLYALDFDHVKRSDDGGHTWSPDLALEKQLTWNGAIPLSSDDDSSGLGDHCDLVLTDMQFDPTNPLNRMAVGQGGAFFTGDGVTWHRLLHTGALPGRPINCVFDNTSWPDDPALYVAFAGRSIVKIGGFLQGPIF